VGFSRLEFLDFHDIGNAPARILHSRFARTTPDPLHGVQERFRLLDAVKLQID